MILVAILTEEQYQSIVGQRYRKESYFYPIQDADNNWIITQQEIDNCFNSEFQWVKDLPLTEYNPKQPPTE